MLKIIYASITGNTERVCQHIEKILKEKSSDLQIEMVRSEQIDISYLLGDGDYIIATSTWNLGQMNQYFQHIYEAIPNQVLSGRFAFIGLGDLVYGEENYCKGMYDIREAVIKSGGRELHQPLLIDGEPDAVMDTAVTEWAVSVL